MSYLFSSTARSLSWIAENPAQFVTSTAFIAGFGWFATNAVIGQDSSHLSPIWDTGAIVGSVDQSARNQEQAMGNLPTHTVLTQRISLKNVPVPTANPEKSRRPAAHSSLVRDIQAVLADVGIYKGKVDGIFGEETRRAILEYQSSAGIIPDGEASFGLLGHVKSAFAVAQVRKGDRAPQPELIVLDPQTVEAVQAGLREFYGSEEITVDGIFGSQTRSALRRFQKRFSLDPTGELDSRTLQKMREAGIVGST